MLVSDTGCCAQKMMKHSKKKQGAPCGRTLQKATCDSDMYNRAFPVGNALFFFVGSVMSLFRLPY